MIEAGDVRRALRKTKQGRARTAFFPIFPSPLGHARQAFAMSPSTRRPLQERCPFYMLLELS